MSAVGNFMAFSHLWEKSFHIERLKKTFSQHYDYYRRDIAVDEVDYLNMEDPDVFSHRVWELEYQRKQEISRYHVTPPHQGNKLD